MEKNNFLFFLYISDKSKIKIIIKTIRNSKIRKIYKKLYLDVSLDRNQRKL